LRTYVLLSAGIKIPHHHAKHLSRESGLPFGDVHPFAEFAGLVGQIVIGACDGQQTGASAG
jgi:hypothetical protein